MTKQESFQNLRTSLIRLYDERMSVYRMVHDSGLDVTRINMNGSVTNIWHSVLTEAEKHGKLPHLVRVASNEYPAHEKTLVESLDAYMSDVQEQTTPRATSPSANQEQSAGVSAATESRQPTEDDKAPGATASKLIPLEMPRGLKVSDVERLLFSTLFSGASKLNIVTEFTDGRTATRVFLIRPTDSDGVKELPVVVKVGPKRLIEEEWNATQRHVLRRLPGFVPVQGEASYIEGDKGEIWGGLRYSLVGDGLFEAKSLAKYVADEGELHNVWHVLHNRLLRQMGELWQSTLSLEVLHFQNSYDAILPVNLTVKFDGQGAAPLQPSTPSWAEPVEAHEGAHSYMPLDQPTIRLDAKGSSLMLLNRLEIQPGDWVQLDNFVVTEIDTIKHEITVNLPHESQSTLSSYRLRVQAAPTDHLHVGDTLPSTIGQVALTRQAMLIDYAEACLGPAIDLSQSHLALSRTTDTILPNPLFALPKLLEHSSEAKFATIHGDLNLRNVLVDPEARTTHIIDSAAAHQDHVLHDLLRLERDTLTDLLAQTLFQAHLPPTMVFTLYHAIHCALVGESHRLGHFAIPRNVPVELHKIYVMLVTIRQTARGYMNDVERWDEYYAGLVIHLLGALKFKDLDKAPAGQEPKALAFWAAATVCWLMEENVDCRSIQWTHVDVSSPDSVSGSSSVQPTPTVEKLPSSRIAEPPAGAQATQTVSTVADDEKTFLNELLHQHKRNLQLLQKQAANFGAGEVPLRLLNQIAAEEEEKELIEQKLGE